MILFYDGCMRIGMINNGCESCWRKGIGVYISLPDAFLENITSVCPFLHLLIIIAFVNEFASNPEQIEYCEIKQRRICERGH